MDVIPVPKILLFDIEITEDLLQCSTEKQNKTTLKIGAQLLFTLKNIRF